jgi:hypothetical protein
MCDNMFVKSVGGTFFAHTHTHIYIYIYICALCTPTFRNSSFMCHYILLLLSVWCGSNFDLRSIPHSTVTVHNTSWPHYYILFWFCISHFQTVECLSILDRYTISFYCQNFMAQTHGATCSF